MDIFGVMSGFEEVIQGYQSKVAVKRASAWKSLLHGKATGLLVRKHSQIMGF